MATRESSTKAKYNMFWAETRDVGNYGTTAANDRGISPYKRGTMNPGAWRAYLRSAQWGISECTRAKPPPAWCQMHHTGPGSKPPPECVRVLNPATCQVLSRQYVTWHPMPNTPEIPVAWGSASTMEGVEESDMITALDVDIRSRTSQQVNKREQGGAGEAAGSANDGAAGGTGGIAGTWRVSRPQPFCVGHVPVGRTRRLTTGQSSALALVKDKNRVKELPAATTLDRMCDIVATATQRMPEGQASHLPPEPGTVSQGQE